MIARDENAVRNDDPEARIIRAMGRWRRRKICAVISPSSKQC